MRSRSADSRRLSYPAAPRLMRVIQAELDSMADVTRFPRAFPAAAQG
jgi:hypothetical protein